MEFHAATNLVIERLKLIEPSVMKVLIVNFYSHNLVLSFYYDFHL